MDETGWVIEVDEGGRICYFAGSLLFPEADPLKAMRFAREQDAEKMRVVLVAGQLSSSVYRGESGSPAVREHWLKAKVSEHMWCEQSPEVRD